MTVEPTHETAGAPIAAPRALSRWKQWQHSAAHWLDKSNQNRLLNLFTLMLAASALVIMLLVGTAIYWIYSSAMVRNAEAAAISVVSLIMNAEVDYLLHQAPDGQRMLVVEPEDLARLDVQMHRYLKPFSMHKIKLYTPDKRIVYSTDASIIGKFDRDNVILGRVLNAGVANSALERKKEFVDIGGGRIQDASIVEAYAPVFDPNQRVVGVFEVYVDITSTRVEIVKVLLLTMTALGMVLSVCLFGLYLPMKRGTLSLIVAHRELNELATRDYLTGAYNRRYITDRVKQEFHRMRRHSDNESHKNSISFIMVDIDHFKKVNDAHGHSAGDEVLRTVAQRLKEGLRDCDVLCRYGGEEFLIMLPHTDAGDAMLVAQRLQQGVTGAPVQVDGLAPLPVTASFGVATSHGGNESEQVAIDRADHALYLAKEGGRNRVVSGD